MAREESVDVVVVGAGIIGAATAFQLARRGHATALYEQYALDHDFGSSHGRSRIFRHAYDKSDYVHLAISAESAWREVETLAGVELLATTGGFDAGPPEEIGPVQEALSQAGSHSTLLSATQMAETCSWLRLPPSWVGLSQPNGGVIAAREALETFVNLARAQGAAFHPHTRVLHLLEEEDHIDVETEEGVVDAETVVVCAGGWASHLLEPLGLAPPIRVTREHVAYYPSHEHRSIPPFIWHTEDGPQFYALPRRPGDSTVKVGHHLAGLEVEPGSHRTPDPDRVALITEFVRDNVPGLEPHPVMAETCLYASTPDDDFVIDRAGRVVLGLGLGGHGFKFAPLIGSLLADLVERRSIDMAIRFGRSRFEEPAQRAG